MRHLEAVQKVTAVTSLYGTFPHQCDIELTALPFILLPDYASWYLQPPPNFVACPPPPTFVVCPPPPAQPRTSPPSIEPRRRFQRNKMFACSVCQRTYSLKRTLRRHMMLECGKEPWLKCPYCSHCSKQRGNLINHVNRKHPDAPKYPTSG